MPAGILEIFLEIDCISPCLTDWLVSAGQIKIFAGFLFTSVFTRPYRFRFAATRAHQAVFPGQDTMSSGRIFGNQPTTTRSRRWFGIVEEKNEFRLEVGRWSVSVVSFPFVVAG